MNRIRELFVEIDKTFAQSGTNPFPYNDLTLLREEFQDEFENVKDECINGDLNTYWMFIDGMGGGGLKTILDDSLERYRVKKMLQKTFFDWFPKYRFLERYDLGEYKDLDLEFKIYDKVRFLLLEVIEIYENRND